MLLRWWIGLAALVLVVCAVHVSTFFDFDPQSHIPGVMWLHGVVLVLFVVMMFYGSRRKRDDGSDPLFGSTTRWMRVVCGLIFAYAMINFILFYFLSEGGGPHDEGGGRYALKSRGAFIRPLTREEFHRPGA